MMFYELNSSDPSDSLMIIHPFFLSVSFSTPAHALVTKATSRAPPSLKALWDTRPRLSKAPSILISLTATEVWKRWRLALIHERERRSRCHSL